MRIEELGATEPLTAISLWEPWATAIAIGAKRYETRHWSTARRGLVAIHGAQTKGEADYFRREPIVQRAFAAAGIERLDQLAFGKVVCTCRIVAMHRAEDVRGGLSALERALGDYSDGRFAWELAEVVRLAVPVPAKGMQGFWKWRRNLTTEGGK